VLKKIKIYNYRKHKRSMENRNKPEERGEWSGGIWWPELDLTKPEDIFLETDGEFGIKMAAVKRAGRVSSETWNTRFGYSQTPCYA